MPSCASCKFVNPVYMDRMKLMEDTSTDDNPKESMTLKSPNIPGNILTVGGGETYRGQTLEAHITHVVETPWRDSVKANQQLVVVGGIYNGRTLNIDLVKPIRKKNARPTLVLLCKESESP